MKNKEFGLSFRMLQFAHSNLEIIKDAVKDYRYLVIDWRDYLRYGLNCDRYDTPIVINNGIDGLNELDKDTIDAMTKHCYIHVTEGLSEYIHDSDEEDDAEVEEDDFSYNWDGEVDSKSVDEVTEMIKAVFGLENNSEDIDLVVRDGLDDCTEPEYYYYIEIQDSEAEVLRTVAYNNDGVCYDSADD